jgi:tRNA pseudouridine38-40 synthase
VRYTWFVKHRLSVPAMRKVIPYLLHEHDFKHFSVHNGGNNTVCTLYLVNLTLEGTHIIIECEGNRFLRKMIRGIVGFMVDVGRGRFSWNAVDDVFRGAKKDIYFAPPQGLFLIEVKF